MTLGSFHRPDEGGFTDISEVHITSIFRVEICSVGKCYCVCFGTADTAVAGILFRLIGVAGRKGFIKLS
jgi:hypothetical protein